jgi:hypothetical protein
MEKGRKVFKYNNTKGGNTGYNLWKKLGNRKKNIPQRIHGLILRDFGIAVLNLILYKNFEFRFPYKLGYLVLRKIKKTPKLTPEGKFDKKSLPIDFGSSYKLWLQQYPGLSRAEINKIPNKKHVYHLNEHSDGYMFKFFWDKKGSSVKNHRIYTFKLTKPMSGYAGKVIKENPQLDFYEVK